MMLVILVQKFSRKVMVEGSCAVLIYLFSIWGKLLTYLTILSHCSVSFFVHVSRTTYKSWHTKGDVMKFVTTGGCKKFPLKELLNSTGVFPFYLFLMHLYQQKNH